MAVNIDLTFWNLNRLMAHVNGNLGKRAFECDGGKTKLIYGSLDPHGVGYIYKVKSDTFHKIDQWQWVSEVACVPVEIIEIKVQDYLHTVEFSREAEEINKALYG